MKTVAKLAKDYEKQLKKASSQIKESNIESTNLFSGRKEDK